MNSSNNLINAGFTVSVENSTYWKTFAALAGAGVFIIAAYFIAKSMTP